MALVDYSIDTSGSPEDVQRKQKLADALMKQGMDSSAAAGGKGGGWVTALNRGLAGALGGYQAGAARQEEQAGRTHAQQIAAGLLEPDGKINQQAYIQASSDPWVQPQQLGAVGKVADWQHQSAQDAEHKREWGITNSRAAAAEARAAADYENTPDQYVPNPRAGEPGQPKFLDQYAQAKAAAEATPGGLKTLTPGGEIYHVDPEGKVVVDHKNDKGVNAEDVPEETINFLADRARMGDTSYKVGYARNPGMVAKIDSAAQQREANGIPISDPAKNVIGNRTTLSARGAAERKLGTINTNNEFFGNNALGALDIAEKASATVPRTDYPGVNKAINAYRTQTGDPKTVALGAALNTVVNDYAKFTGGGVGSDSLRGHAEAILNGAHSHEQLQAIVHMMRTEIKRGQQSPGMVREGFDSLYAPHGSAAQPPQAQSADPLGIR